MGTTAYAAYSAQQNGFNRKNETPNLNHTPTAMKRWSTIDKPPPPVGKINEIHVYDFDNTLFKTPLPNTKIWNAHTIGTLANPGAFVNGGWWHDSRILAATGEGLAKEEPKAWSGWWNETIVELVQLTMEQDDAVCVLLTGRSESGFSDLIKRMVKAKNLDFDIIALKPAAGPNNQSFASTMAFKQEFLTALMETYKHANEIRIYEDRPKHVKGFRDFLTDYNRKQNGNQRTRGNIKGEVIQVADTSTNLDPVAEVAEVQHLLNLHNESLPQRRAGVRGERLKIVKSVFYTGYIIDPADTGRLLSLAAIPQHFYDADLKLHANNIMIVPRACPSHILEKVGGIGSKMRWEVTGTACFENNIWAVCVRPVPPTAKFHTENPSPFVVLAVRKGARPVDAGKIQNWQPVPPDKAFWFETVVGEKVLLSIQAEDLDDSFSHAKSGLKRKHHEDDFRARPSHPTGPRNFNQFGGRGRGGGFRGGNNNRNFRGQRGGARGRGGRGGGGHHYKSLDDVGTRENGQVSYEDDSAASRGFNTQPPLGPAAQYGGGGHGQQGHGGWQNNNNRQGGGGNNQINGNGFGGFGDNY